MYRDSIYSRNGDLLAEHGSIKVFKMNGGFYMEKDQELIYSSEELSDYIWQVNDKPYGNCLVLGFGLGIAAKYILSLPQVDTLTVVEKDLDITKSQPVAGIIDDNRFKLVVQDYLTYLYTAKNKFDFVLLDCYAHVDMHSLPLVADLVIGARKVLTNHGILIGWMDSKTPETLVDPFYTLFVKN